MISEFLNQIIELIEKKIGLKPKSVSFLIWEWVLKERMKLCNLSTYEDYYKRLQMSPHEVQELVELIVVPETWFFRDKSVFEFLTSLIHEKKIQNGPLKVLSVACSTGEEPYSIAMTLLAAGLAPKDFMVDALDISKKSLTKAEIGIYGKNSFRGKELDYRDVYFDHTSEGYAIKEDVKQHVHFYFGNILDKTPFDAHSYPLIFCRNVLIYLDTVAQERTFKQLKSFLAPGGYLIVGPAEMQIARNAGFEPVHFPRAYAFTLEQKEEKPVEEKPRPIQAKGTRQRLLQKLCAPFAFADLPPSAEAPAMIQVAPSIQGSDTKTLMLEEALKLANGGFFEEASSVCFKFMHQYGANPDIYYLLGLIQHAIGDEVKAEEFFHKTVYLRPSHYEALVYLALLHEKKGEFNKAELFRKRAQKNL